MRRFAVAALALALALPATLQAQETAVEIPPEFMDALKKDVSTLRMDAMQSSIELEAGTASAFWAIYEEYLAELEDITEGRAELIKDYALEYETLTNDQAVALGRRALGMRMDREALLNRYFERIAEEVGGKTAAQFFQIETQVQLLLDLRIAMEIPLVRGG